MSVQALCGIDRRTVHRGTLGTSELEKVGLRNRVTVVVSGVVIVSPRWLRLAEPAQVFPRDGRTVHRFNFIDNR